MNSKFVFSGCRKLNFLCRQSPIIIAKLNTCETEKYLEEQIRRYELNNDILQKEKDQYKKNNNEIEQNKKLYEEKLKKLSHLKVILYFMLFACMVVFWGYLFYRWYINTEDNEKKNNPIYCTQIMMLNNNPVSALQTARILSIALPVAATRARYKAYADSLNVNMTWINSLREAESHLCAEISLLAGLQNLTVPQNEELTAALTRLNQVRTILYPELIISANKSYKIRP